MPALRPNKGNASTCLAWFSSLHIPSSSGSRTVTSSFSSLLQLSLQSGYLCLAQIDPFPRITTELGLTRSYFGTLETYYAGWLTLSGIGELAYVLYRWTESEQISILTTFSEQKAALIYHQQVHSSILRHSGSYGGFPR